MNLSNLDISKLTDEEVEELIHLLELKDQYDKYNVIERFEPYPYQMKFFEAGTRYQRRFLCAANRH